MGIRMKGIRFAFLAVKGYDNGTLFRVFHNVKITLVFLFGEIVFLYFNPESALCFILVLKCDFLLRIISRSWFLR